MDENEEFDGLEDASEEYFDGDSRWGEHIPATEEEARCNWHTQIDNEWEMWFRLVASNYPECEKAEGFA